jgi:hypothetical protein
MSNKNLFWLLFGIGIGVLVTVWWHQQQRVWNALANHDARIGALEFGSNQRAIADRPPKDRVKWYAGMLALAAAAIKLIFMLVQLCGHHKF